jgi:hypothetical protein
VAAQLDLTIVGAQSAQFHGQTLEEKLKYKLNDPSVSQGYTADGAESSDPHGGRSHKECYEHRRVNKLAPAAGDLDDWTAWADDFYNVSRARMPLVSTDH